MICVRHNISFRCILLALAVTVSLNTSISHGTVMRKLSLDELVSHADTIVIGTCERTEAIWHNRKIFTVATIRVKQPIKGKSMAEGTIKLYIPGGSVREPMPIKMYVPGAAKVVSGEEMVLFLKSGGVDIQQKSVVGMAQGKIPVKLDAKTGEKVISRVGPIKHVTMIDQFGKTLISNEMLESAKEDSLKNFLRNVEQIMAEHEAKNAEQNSLSGDDRESEKGDLK